MYAATLVAKTFRIMMAVATRNGYKNCQFDIGNVFLESFIGERKELITVQLLVGYELLGDFEAD